MHSYLVTFIRIYLLSLACLQTAWGMSFQRYHSQPEIAAALREAAAENPELVRFQILGKSLQGREIALVTISKNWAPETPAIYFNGTHHGNEKASTEAVLGLIEFFQRSQDRADIDRLLRRYKLILQPLVNPDGHALNSRSDSQGIDPNRDYATPSKPESEAFRLIETRLVQRLLKRENVVASAAFHAGLEAVLWPWCHTPALSQHEPVFKNLGQAIAQSMNMPKYTQSYYDYQTDGEFIDYAYMRHGIYALTLEVAQEARPAEAELEAVVQRAITGSLTFLKGLEPVLEPRQDLAKKERDKARTSEKEPSKEKETLRDLRAVL